jgi:hypothetical protein
MGHSVEPPLSIHLAAVTDLDHLDEAALIVDRVDDSVGALPDSIPLGLPCQLPATDRTREASETLDSRHDPNSDRPRLDRLELPGSRGLDANAIACHAAEAS